MSVWGSRTDDIWIADYDRGLYRGDGRTWTLAKEARYASDVSGTSARDVWVVGGAVEPPASLWFHWDGAGWSGQHAPFGHGYLRVSAGAPDEVWIGGGPSRWDGTKWAPVVGGPGSVYDLWAPSRGELWALAEHRTQAGGSEHLHAAAVHYAAGSWSTTPLLEFTGGGGRWLYAIWARAADDVWVVGSKVFHFDGMTWSQVCQPDEELTGISGTATRDVWAVGARGSILRLRR